MVVLGKGREIMIKLILFVYWSLKQAGGGGTIKD